MANYHKKLRKHKRLKLEKAVNIEIKVDDELIPSSLINVSLGGAKLKIGKFIKPGTYIDVKFSSKNCINSIVKRIVKLSDAKEYYLGIQFKEEWKGTIADLVENEILIKRKFARRLPKGDLLINAWRDGHEVNKQMVKIKDISEGGAKIITKISWDKGTILNLNFKGNYVLVGEIKWKSLLVNTKEIQYEMGIQFVKPKNSEKILSLKSAIDKDPKNTSKHTLLAEQFKAEGRYKEALESYVNATELEPANESLFVSMAMVYMDQNKLEKAIQALENAIKIKPNLEVAKMLLNKIQVVSK